MRQCNSSKDFFQIGKTLLNRNFSLSVLVENVANYADNKDLLREAEREYFKRNANSAKAFPVLSNIIRRLHDNNYFPIPTKYGQIFDIAQGVSKIALIFQAEEGERFVLKTDKEYDNNVIDRCKTYQELKNTTSGEVKNVCRQTAEQAAMYDAWRDEDIGMYLLPIFRYYKRYNVIIEPFVPFIGDLTECCQYAEREDEEDTMASIAYQYGLEDVRYNSGNCGVLNGRVYFIDYVL